MERAQGIDVSAYQPSIDWKKVKEAEISFAYLKATQGISYVSKEFKKQLAGARSVGIYPGAYHYAELNKDPIKQMDHFYAVIEGLGVAPGELIPVIDFEDEANASKMSNQACADWLQAALKRGIELGGYDPTVYGGPYFLKKHLTGAKIDLGISKLWLAAYPRGQFDAQTVQIPAAPLTFPQVDMWQYAGDPKANTYASCPGVGGRCDRNVYNGTEEDLLNFVGGK